MTSSLTTLAAAHAQLGNSVPPLPAQRVVQALG